MKKNLSLRAKLICTFVAVGVTPLVISSYISYKHGSEEITQQAFERVKVLGDSKANGISSYLDGESQGIVDFAGTDLAIDALEKFDEAFYKLSTTETESVDWKSKSRESVLKYYTQNFLATYTEKNKGKKLDTDQLFKKIDDATIAAQLELIVNNENPLGKKDLMMTPHRNTTYAHVHSKYHPQYREYLVHHSLYDMFLVNKEGRVVYTVFKETDFASSLKSGAWSESSLAKAFEESKKLEKGQVYIQDFSPYAPSYDDPAAFAATPIFKDGKYVGSLMIQLPLDKISAAAGAREGLGKRGETVLLGEDMKLRADTFRNKDTHTVAASYASDSKLTFESDSISHVKKGETGVMRGSAYDGVDTLSYYRPLKIKNLTWYLLTELDSSEVYAGLNQLTYYTLGILFFGTLLIGIIAYLFGTMIANNLGKLIGILNHTSTELSSASTTSSKSASELSEAATEQAASLQETMASVEEISAMINQNAESAVKVKNTVDDNQKSTEDGSRSVDAMMHAIDDIKDTNDKILSQMESSNKEFSEIVKIISEIGEKTKVINDIVFQTKLLSFNASVEAARAGEHGKGFAVVAEEVGNLAQMSGNAAKEITDMLSNSIKKVNEIVQQTTVQVDKLVEVGKDKIVMGQSTAQKCRVSLEQILENAKTMSSMVAEIAHASKEQAQGVQEINKAMGQLDQVTQQNSNVAQSSSAQADQLNKQSIELTETLQKLVFFVEGDQSLEAVSAKKTFSNVVPFKGANSKRVENAKNKIEQMKTLSEKPLAKVAGDLDVPSASHEDFENF